MKNLKIEYLKTEQLTPYANNAKIHTEEQVEQIKKSIQEFGFNDPIAIWKNNEIIEGHGRLLAAQELGIKQVPVIRLDDLTDDERRAYMLVHNQLTMTTGFDMELLNIELEQIDIDMAKYGFEPLDTGEPAQIVEDDVPEEVETRCKLGDVWKLGNHRLICGDATDEATIKRLMNGEKADLLLTDPPYNVDYEGGTEEKMKIMNDNMDDASFRKFLRDAFKAADRVMKDGAAFYIWHADTEGYNFRGAVQDAGWKVRECLIWNKNSLVLGRQDYHYKHEPCLYGWKSGAAHYFINSRAETTVIPDGKEIVPKKMKKAELVKVLEDILHKAPATVIDENKPSKNDMHPTMKPLKLMGYLIANSSRQGEAVLDSFGGSGSTLIACEQLNRRCYTAELDEHFCDVIIQRWENLTGTPAVKEE